MTFRQFPDGFYWGSALSSYQAEGGNENTDWARAARAGRVPPAGRLADHYHLFEADFDIARKLGQNAHRLSVEWARIEPTEGEFNMEAIRHYREVLQALRARGLRPFVTLWHFSLPDWFAARGGFTKRSSVKTFARYCTFVVEQLGDLCSDFATINEPNIYASSGWLQGIWPPFHTFSPLALLDVRQWPNLIDPNATQSIASGVAYFYVVHNLILAHKAAYRAIKKVAPSTDISVVKHIILYHADGAVRNRFYAYLSNMLWTHWFLKSIARDCDSIGINYYMHQKFGETIEYPRTDTGWDMFPQGIYGALRMAGKYGKPLTVSEAGIADADDSDRAAYVRLLVRGIWRAIQSGVDVRGFFYWSLLDNYEWAEGTAKRFGLVAVNYETLERTIRESALAYKTICEENGFNEIM